MSLHNRKVFVMNKEDFNEVRKALKPKESNVQEVYATYVNGEKTVLFSSKKEWFSMTDDEKLTYSTIFSKVLSGKAAVNLHLLNVHREDQQSKLLEVGRKQEEVAIKKLTEQIVDQYNSKESFAVLVATCSYGVQSYASDGAKLEDSFDETYRFVVCAVCPTKLEKPSIIYKHDAAFFESAKRDYVLQNPSSGFLYPTFENRSSNVNKILFYTKNIKSLPIDVIDRVFDLELTTTLEDDQEIFSSIVQESFSNQLTVNDVHKVNLAIADELSNHLEDDTDGIVSTKELNDIIVRSGGEEVQVGDGFVQLSSLVSTKYCLQNDADIKIVAGEEAINEIKQEVVNGVPSLVIPLNGFTMNGIPLN